MHALVHQGAVRHHSVMRIRAALAILVSYWLTAGVLLADQLADALKAFDTLCVSTGLHRDRFAANARLHKSVPIAADQLRLMGDADVGFWVRVGENTFAASYGAKRGTDGALSKNCSVSTTRMSLADARKMIESNYRVRLVSHERQGLSTLTMYAADLAGYVKRTAIVIQHAVAEDSTVSVSIVEF